MASWYVDYDNGNNDGAGTLGDPFKTIDKGIDDCSAGDTIYVRGSPYNSGNQYENSGGNRGLEPSKNGTSGNPITVRAYQSETVTILSASNGNKVALYLSGVDYFDWIDLNFDYDKAAVDTDNEGMVVLLWSENHNFTDCVVDLTQGNGSDLFDNETDNFDGFGIQIVDSSSITLDNVEILNQINGIQISGTSHSVTFKNGHIHHCYWSGVVIRRNAASENSFRVLFEDTIIEWLFAEDGLQCGNSSSGLYNADIVFRRCVFRGIGENALDFKSAIRVLVEDCYIYGIIGSNNGHDGAWNRDSWYSVITGSGNVSADVIIRGCVIFDANPLNCGLSSGSAEGYQFYFNTIINNERDFTGPNTAFANAGYQPSGITHVTSPKNHQIVNNIIVGHSEVSMSINPDTNMRIDYNIWDGPCELGGSEFATLGDWQTELQGQGAIWGEAANSLKHTHAQVDFVSVAADVNVGQIGGGDWDDYPDVTTNSHEDSDFRVSAISPAVDAGGPITYADGADTAATVITCDHVRWAYDGFGITGETGDVIIINGQTRTIVSIDYDNKQITVNENTTWNNNDEIHLAVYGGTSPDIGAFQIPPSAYISVPTGSIELTGYAPVIGTTVDSPTDFDRTDASFTLVEKAQRTFALEEGS